jgi:hypothetical protein
MDALLDLDSAELTLTGSTLQGLVSTSPSLFDLMNTQPDIAGLERNAE